MGNLDFVAIDLETATSHRNSICDWYCKELYSN